MRTTKHEIYPDRTRGAAEYRLWKVIIKWLSFINGDVCKFCRAQVKYIECPSNIGKEMTIGHSAFCYKKETPEKRLESFLSKISLKIAHKECANFNHRKGWQPESKDIFGISASTLRMRSLRRLMFYLVTATDMNKCSRGDCSNKSKIITMDNFSVEHARPWRGNPPGLYYDTDNIVFSHRACNRSDQDPLARLYCYSCQSMVSSEDFNEKSIRCYSCSIKANA